MRAGATVDRMSPEPTDTSEPTRGTGPVADGRLVGGRYRLARVLGRGGMGVVWAGHDEVLQRPVAVKEVIPPPGVDAAERDGLRARTMREARTAARICADGAVTIYDVVEEDERPWIVMEALPPRTLQDVVAERGMLPPNEVAAIGIDLLAGLAAAHAAGILHRDVKPGNVMFRSGTHGGGAVLGDFGIAHFDGDSTLTSTGMVMGSPAYVAPERAHGKPASAASDLWSLGVTLWTALEGRSPFERDNALATLTAVITEEAPRAPHAGPLGPALEGLLRKDPALRLDAATVRELLQVVVAPPSTTAALPVAPPAPASAPPAPVPLPAPAAACGGEVPVPPPAAVRTGPVGARDDADHAEDRPRGRRWLAPLVGLVALALVALAVAVWTTGGDRRAQDPGASPSASATDQEPVASDPPSQGGSPEPAPSGSLEGGGSASSPARQETTTPAQGGGVPAGFELWSDPTGFSVAVPAGWEAEQDGPRVYLRDPGSAAYLMVDQTDDPAADAVADWRQQEPSVAARLENYERIGEIEAVDFRGWEAADWEFVFGRSQGTRVLNRNVIPAPDQAYALYWSVPASQWDAMLPVHEQVVASFQPAS